MSYLPTIQPCKFSNYPNQGVSYGYRCYDSYKSSYNNTWKKEDVTKLPLQLLKKIMYDKPFLHDENLRNILSLVKEKKCSIKIGNCILDWQSIKNILTEM
jgi:hypothetical protein